MKSIFKILSTFSFCILVLSCQKTIDNLENPADGFVADSYELGYKSNPRAFALKFTDFIGDGSENIVRLDEDTTRISIIDGLLKYLEISELKAGDVLNIWEDIDRPPYIRVVDDVEKTAGGYIVTTRPGNIGDVFYSLDACLDTELYSDITERPERTETRTGTLEDDYKYIDDPEDFEQFVEESGKIHPFIYYEPNEGTDSFDYELAEETYDEMVDSMLDSKGISWKKNWTIIDTKMEHINILPKKDENSSPIGFFVNDASIAMRANIELYFQFNLTKSNKFWAKLDGNFDARVPLHFSFAGKQLRTEKEVPVCEFSPIFTAFSIGPFVIPVMIRHGFIFKCYASMDANLSFMIPFYYNASFQAGPKYENGKWSSLAHYESQKGINFEEMKTFPSSTLSLSGTVGFFYHIGAYLGDAIGPFFEVGPKASVAANAGLVNNNVMFNTRADIAFGGYVGADIKIWKFNLGKVSIPYSAVSQELWNLDFTFKPDDLMKN